jgi:diguanylate cyclase (GGDEF)-like protein/PAS domain S-box-containing protein
MRVEARSGKHARRVHSDAFHSAYIAAGVAMARLTQAAVIIDVNPRFAEMVRRPADELAGTELLELLHPDDAAAVRAGRLSSFAAGAIHAELRFVAGSDFIHGRTTISIAREPGDQPDSLVLTVEDLTESRRREGELERRRRLDPDTGLPTADLLSRRLGEAIRLARTGGPPPALLMVELDRLSALGEEPGASVVLELLDQATRRLSEQLRPRDFVARTGANEFGIVFAEGEGGNLAEEVGRRLLAGLEPPFRLAGQDVKVPVALGVANYPADGHDPDGLIRRARRDMYGVEAAGQVADETEPPTDELEQRVALLEPVSLFQSVSDQVLRRIARYLSAQTAAAGEQLAWPGGPPALRIIEEGLCEVRTPEQVPLLTLGPGDFIGAESMLLDEPAAVHMHALTECRMLVLEPDLLDRVAPPGTAFRDALRLAASQRDNQFRVLIDRPAHRNSGSSAINLAVYSAKGGSGRTTLALNLAAELGHRHSGEVLLVDLSLPYNHVALLASLSPSTCLARAGQAAPESFGPLVWSAVLPHPAGFMVLPATLRPEESELVTADLVARMLAVLSPSYRYIVFDLGVNLDDRVLAALEMSDELVLMVTPELASMHDTRQVLDLATRVLQIPAGRIHTVLNHRSPDSLLSRKVVEDVLGRQLATELRYDGTAPEMAGLEGRVQVKPGPRSEFSRGVRQLLDALPSIRAAETA